MDVWLGLKPKPQPEKPATRQPATTKPAATTPATAVKYRVVPRKDGCFNIVGPTGTITSRTNEQAAVDYITQLMFGSIKRPTPVHAQPTRASSRVRSKPSVPPKIETRGRKSGAAWHGKTRKEPEAVQPE